MPIKRSAYKQLRADKKKRVRNMRAVSEIKTLSRKINAATQNRKEDEARKLLKEISSKLHKASSRKIIHYNTASRKLSRLSRNINNAFKPKSE